MQAGEGGDELGGVAEEAEAVIVAEPPAARQRVARHDLLEVLAVILDAEVSGGSVERHAVLLVRHGRQGAPQGNDGRAAVKPAFGRLPLQARHMPAVAVQMFEVALPAA